MSDDAGGGGATEDQPAIGESPEARNLFVGLVVLSLLAAFVPVFTPLPLGYLLAAGGWVVGATLLYLFAYRRVQERVGVELATARRAIAGLAGAYLLYQVLETGVRILSVGPGPAVPEARPVLLVVAVVVAVAGAVLAEPTRLVWFVAAVFVLNFLVVESLRVTGARPVVEDPTLALVAYLGVLAPAALAAYLLVYRGLASRLAADLG